MFKGYIFRAYGVFKIGVDTLKHVVNIYKDQQELRKEDEVGGTRHQLFGDIRNYPRKKIKRYRKRD